MRSLVAASVVVLTLTALPAGTVPAAGAPVSTRVFTDAAGDVPTGVDLLRARVTNRGSLTVTTKHRNIRRLSNDSFTIFVDTRTSHPGPEYAIAGGLSDGTDWTTGRATRNWRIHADPLDAIGLCNSRVSMNFATETLRVTMGRDCLGGHKGRVRVSIKVSDQGYADYGPAKKTFYPWTARG